MEKNLILILILAIIVVSIILIVSKIVPFFIKTQQEHQILPSSQTIKDEYRSIIEKSKSDYKNFRINKYIAP